MKNLLDNITKRPRVCNTSVNSTCAHHPSSPTGNCEAFARVISLGGEALAYLA